MIYNSLSSQYKSPFGAVGVHTDVSFSIQIEVPSPPVMEWFQFGSNSPFESVPMRQMPGHWWQVSFSPCEEGVLFYRFRINDQTVLHRQPDGSAAFGEGNMWQLTVHSSNFKVPEDFKGRIIYQIFPDRYAKGTLTNVNPYQDRVIHSDWSEAVNSLNDSDGIFRCNDYFGGNLRGIIQHLEDIRLLGTGILYLNPIFEAHSNHRYNTADYFTIDPMLGSLEDFKELCDKAHQMNIKIILDGVFNHSGSDSIYFNRENRYPICGAFGHPESPYSSWYCWKNQEHTEYESWWDFETLPDFNKDDPGYLDMICGENGVIRTWLRNGADGWRLDVVDELPDLLVKEIRKAAKAEKEDALILGEVWEDASVKISYGKKREYLLGYELDCVMNYPFRTTICRFFRFGDSFSFFHSVLELLEHYPKPCWGLLMNMLGTHDVPRPITVFGGEPQENHDRDWQREHNTLTIAQYYKGRQMFMLAVMMLYCLPGCPSLYYGDEAGLYGYQDPFNRAPYPWGKEDIGLLECIRQLGQIRNSHPVLTDGDIIPLHWGLYSIGWFRQCETETIGVFVNIGSQPVPVPDSIKGTVLYSIGSFSESLLSSESAILIQIKKNGEILS